MIQIMRWPENESWWEEATCSCCGCVFRFSHFLDAHDIIKDTPAKSEYGDHLSDRSIEKAIKCPCCGKELIIG